MFLVLALLFYMSNLSGENVWFNAFTFKLVDTLIQLVYILAIALVIALSHFESRRKEGDHYIVPNKKLTIRGA